MYIEPNSNIKIYANIPLDNTYNHTIFFSNINQQNEYFHGDSAIGHGLKFNLTNQSYQRVVKGSMRIAVKADDLYDCNYLAFRNTSFGVKWFYGFITGVEYINNETSQITYEIDVMQTYLFDVTLLESFVEREHSITDIAGDNIVSENIEIGDIVCNATEKTNLFNSYTAIVAIGKSFVEGEPVGGTVAGLFSGVTYIPALIDNDEQISNLKNLLDAIVKANDQDSVVSITVMPSAFYTDTKNLKIEVKSVNKNTTLHGYVPRNKKLLTYPYNYLAIDCGNNDATYRYEWFKTPNCNFFLTGTVTCNPEIMIVPQGYNGVDAEAFNWNEKLVMNGFPQIPWVVDSFRAWLAQEASTTALQGLSSLVATASGLSTGNLASATSGIMGIGNTINQTVLASNRPNQVKGVNTGTVDVATRSKDFYFKQMQITEQYARIIDDYFDMYGYATRRIKIPNRDSRPHWNYVKTNNCIVTSNKAPAEDVNKICKIYDKGITFWKHPNEVGNYTLNNSPI